MEIIRNLNQIESLDDETAITLGTFDGLHIGHIKIINQLVEDAKENDLKSLVYTFSNHPMEVTNPNNIPSKIISLEEKIKKIKSLGVDYLFLLEFNDFQMNIDPELFIEELLVKKLRMKHLVVGYDFTFGKKAMGNTNLLIEKAMLHDYSYDIVEPIKMDYVRVSSTLIRALLKSGKIEEANFYLGRKYTLQGKVIHGKKLGRKIGYPTANIEVKDHFAILKPGVYITKTYIDDTVYYSVSNIGFNPTFEYNKFSLETYIFDFDQKIYDKTIRVEFYKMIRDEIKFDSVDELKEYIKWDVYNVKRYFNIL